MERIDLNVQIREETGKKSNKLLRKEGYAPGVVYRGKETVHLKIFTKDLFSALHTKAGENVLINLNVSKGQKGKGKQRVVIIKEVQHHPIKDEILHVDFQEISLTEKLTVDVPVVVKGEAEGVTKEEGILEHIMWEVKVECLPTDIPEKIEVDVTSMKIGDHIAVKDLQTPTGVKVLEDPEQIVVSVVPPRAEEVEVAPEEEITEPELIREKKEEEEQAEGEEDTSTDEKKGEKKEGKEK